MYIETKKSLSPVTADRCAEFFGIRSKIQKLKRQLKKKNDFFRRTIMSDGFVAMEIRLGESEERSLILSHSTRSDCDADYQLSYFYQDEPTMHENFYRQGANVNYKHGMDFRDLIFTLTNHVMDGGRVTILKGEQ